MVLVPSRPLASGFGFEVVCFSVAFRRLWAAWEDAVVEMQVLHFVGLPTSAYLFVEVVEALFASLPE